VSGRLALVLSGGGAQAAYFGAGVALGLADLGLRPDVLSGASAGALNAGLLGCGVHPQALVRLWSGIDGRDVYQVRKDVWRLPRWRAMFGRPGADFVGYALESIGWTWALDTAPARRLLVEHAGGAGLRITAGTAVVVSAVDSVTGDLVRFTNQLPERDRDSFRRTDLRVDHLLASSAAPLLFPPVRINGRSYIDAGLVANTPLAPALAYEPGVVVVVASSNAGPMPDSGSLDDALALLFANVARFALLQDFRHACTINTLAANAPAATAKREVKLILVEPAAEFSISGFLRFDPQVARVLTEHGRERVCEAMSGFATM
jgi:NTE family protein